MAKIDQRAEREKRRRRENHETILHAAETVLLLKGVSSMSMDDVGAEAGFSKATLYRYFKNKAELVFEILAQFIDDFEQRLTAVVARPAPAREKLRAWVEASLRLLSEKENMTRIFLLDRSFMRLLQIFQHQLGASWPVEGEHHSAKWPQQPAEPSRNPRLHMATVDQLAIERSYHCTIGRNQRRIRSQAEPLQQRHRIRHAPACGDGNSHTGLLRRPQRLRIAPAYRLLVVRQQRAIHVNRYQPNGRVHVPSVPGALRAARKAHRIP